MLKPTKITIAILLLAIIIFAAPASAVMYHDQTKSITAEKIVGIAENAQQKVENLIALVSVNETALDIIETNFAEEWQGNLTLFEEGKANVTAANEALLAEDYESAIGNATQALEIFREVLRSINYMLCETEVHKGQTIDAQGLIVAMQRALERIDRIRELLDEDATEALALLDEAETYLDVETARLWLLDGNVTQTAQNVTQANQLISEAHQYLKEQAQQANEQRVGNYLEQMQSAGERIRERWQSLNLQNISLADLDLQQILDALGLENVDMDLENINIENLYIEAFLKALGLEDVEIDLENFDLDVLLHQLGYESIDDLIQSIQEMAENIKGSDDIKGIIDELKGIGSTMQNLDQGFTGEIGQYIEQHVSGYQAGNTSTNTGTTSGSNSGVDQNSSGTGNKP